VADRPWHRQLVAHRRGGVFAVVGATLTGLPSLPRRSARASVNQPQLRRSGPELLPRPGYRISTPRCSPTSSATAAAFGLRLERLHWSGIASRSSSQVLELNRTARSHL
jgi:hypothetical protein